MKPNTLILFTNSFPYGKGEQYLENELPFYADEFKRIVFVPVNLEGEARTIPSNAEVLDIHKKVTYKKSKYISLIPKFNKYYSTEKNLRKKDIGGNKKEHFKLFYNANAYAEAIENWMKESGIQENGTLFYSYWFYHWVSVMTIIKTSFPKSKYVSRAHLYDIYDYLNYNYWGGIKAESLDHLVVISDHAKSFIDTTYNLKSGNVETLRLGVKNSVHLNPAKKQSEFVLASCSTMREDKRLDFIVNVLKHSKKKLKWIHFGDGPLKQEIEELVKLLPDSIKVELKGFVPNDQLLNYYSEKHIDLFLNLSSREGIPVSLMEAISFGIPVLGTNVFGTPELVNSNTGILVDLKEDAKMVATKIDQFLEQEIDREKIVAFQKEYFSAEKNYEEFKKILIHEK